MDLSISQPVTRSLAEDKSCLPEDAATLHDMLKKFSSSLSASDRREFEDYSIHAEMIMARSKYRNIGKEDILSPGECAILEEIESCQSDTTPARDPSIVVILKTTRLCNLRCIYCHSWAEGPNNVMKFPVLAHTIRNALQAPGAKRVEFVWHGGEATLLGTRYYKKMLWLQHYFAPDDVMFQNILQTNGVEISDEMIEFIVDNKISVGISSDGPPEISDVKRIDKKGLGVSAKLNETLSKLKNRGVSFGILSVSDQDIASKEPEYLLDYYVKIGAKSVDILNVIPENNNLDIAVGSYIPFSEFIEYMCKVYVVWRDRYQSLISIRTFKSLYDRLSGTQGGACEFAGNCQGKYLTIEANGAIAACDKYIGDPEYVFSSHQKEGMYSALASSSSLTRADTESKLFQEQSAQCKWHHVCSGGCPHDRKITEKFSGAIQTCCGWKPLIELISADMQSGTVNFMS